MTATQNRMQIAALLRRSAASLLQERAFDRAALMAQAAGDTGLLAVARFGDLVARERWAEAVRLACDRLRRNPVDGEMRAAAVDALSQPGRSADAIAPLEALTAENDVGVIAGALCLVAYSVNGRDLNLDAASSRLWSTAFFWILDECRPELMAKLLALILPLAPRVGIVRDLADVVARLPARIAAREFVDRREVWLQFAPAEEPDSKSLIVFFCGLDGRIGMPLNLFHRWAARVPAHLVYLRDSRNEGFVDGVQELGGGLGGLAAFVSDFAATLGITHLGLYGNSKGGFAAARIGAMIGAQRIVVAGGVALQRRLGSDPAPPEVREAARHEVSAAILEALRRSGHDMETIVVYSSGLARDTADARCLVPVPGVRLMPLERNRHNVATELARNGTLGRLLEWTAGVGTTGALLSADLS